MKLPKTCLFLALCALLGACDSSTSKEETAAEAVEESDLTPQEKSALAASRPFLEAIAAHDYKKAYAQLSGHAQARMSPNQFSNETEETVLQANEKKAVTNATEQDFINFMLLAEKAFGIPDKVISADPMSTDPQVLSGKGDAMETAFSIGNMPASVPFEIRKAAVRAQIRVKLSPADLKKAAEAEGVSVEELQKNEDFEPYLNLKVVLVEEAGKTSVGYFEFTPPSVWD